MKRLTNRYENGLAYYEIIPGQSVIDRLADIEDILGDNYDLEYLCDLVKAYEEGRCVIFQPGYSVVKSYSPKDEDGLYTMTACGVISEEEYKNIVGKKP